MGLSDLDNAVQGACLAGITVFGSRFRRSPRSVRDCFFGSRLTSWVVISFSNVATETSTLTLIGVPALAYATCARPKQGGSHTYLQGAAGYAAGTAICSAVGQLASRYSEGPSETGHEPD